MLYGVDINQRVEFISSRDISDPKTVFVLRPLGGLELARIGDTDKALIEAIVEIRNMPDGMTKEDYVSSLDSISLWELVSKANVLNKVTGQDEKN